MGGGVGGRRELRSCSSVVITRFALILDVGSVIGSGSSDGVEESIILQDVEVLCQLLLSG